MLKTDLIFNFENSETPVESVCNYFFPISELVKSDNEIGKFSY